MPIKKVFLSSTARDLKEYREAAYKATEGLGDYQVTRVEDFKALDWDSDEYIRFIIGSCDLFVGILGNLYGSPKNGNEKSYTEREYDFAIEANIPVLMFVASNDIRIPPQLIESNEQQEKLKSFKQRLYNTSSYITTFSSPEDLAFRIKKSIINMELITKERNIPGKSKSYSRLLFQVPPLPNDFIDRPQESEKIKRLLFAYAPNHPIEFGVTAICGMGGIGKTVLASRLAHDPDVLKRFSDGIFWTTLGKEPKLLYLLMNLNRALGDYEISTTVYEASSNLKRLLNDRSVLLILDDARRMEDVTPFFVIGPSSQILITTRNGAIANDLGANSFEMNIMTQEQSLALISKILDRELKGSDREHALSLAQGIGYLPIALVLSAQRIKEGVPWTEVMETTLRYLDRQEISNNSYSSQTGDLLGASDDQVAKDDQLGFKYYIEAFADLIESPYTSRPLTIGIYGSWGMGKSFLLKHIAETLNQRRKNRITEGKSPINVHVVNFNAWEYSASEIVWPGLVRKVMDQLEPKREMSQNYIKYFKSKLYRTLKNRFHESQGWFIFSIIILLPIFFIIIWLNLDPTSFWGQIIV